MPGGMNHLYALALHFIPHRLFTDLKKKVTDKCLVYLKPSRYLSFSDIVSLKYQYGSLFIFYIGIEKLIELS